MEKPLWTPSLKWAERLACTAVRHGHSPIDSIRATVRGICRPSVPWTDQDEAAVFRAAVEGAHLGMLERYAR